MQVPDTLQSCDVLRFLDELCICCGVQAGALDALALKVQRGAHHQTM